MTVRARAPRHTWYFLANVVMVDTVIGFAKYAIDTSKSPSRHIQSARVSFTA